MSKVSAYCDLYTFPIWPTQRPPLSQLQPAVENLTGNRDCACDSHKFAEDCWLDRYCKSFRFAFGKVDSGPLIARSQRHLTVRRRINGPEQDPQDERRRPIPPLLGMESIRHDPNGLRS